MAVNPEINGSTYAKFARTHILPKFFNISDVPIQNYMYGDWGLKSMPNFAILDLLVNLKEG